MPQGVQPEEEEGWGRAQKGMQQQQGRSPLLRRLYLLVWRSSSSSSVATVCRHPNRSALLITQRQLLCSIQ